MGLIGQNTSTWYQDRMFAGGWANDVEDQLAEFDLQIELKSTGQKQGRSGELPVLATLRFIRQAELTGYTTREACVALAALVTAAGEFRKVLHAGHIDAVARVLGLDETIEFDWPE